MPIPCVFDHIISKQVNLELLGHLLLSIALLWVPQMVSVYVSQCLCYQRGDRSVLPRIHKASTLINNTPITPCRGLLFTPVTQSGT